MMYKKPKIEIAKVMEVDELLVTSEMEGPYAGSIGSPGFGAKSSVWDDDYYNETDND